jgi:oligopeptidase B
LPADQPNGEFKVIKPRAQGVEYHVTHRADNFLILTNENAVNFKLMSAPVAKPGPENWAELIPHREQVTLDGTLPFEKFLVILQRENAQQRIVVQDDVNRAEYTIDMREDAYSVEFGENPEYHTNMLRFVYQSMVTPNSVYDYDMENWTRHLRKSYQVGGGFDKRYYESERVFATAPDGEQVPISIVYRKDKFHQDGTNPLYLYGYGAYGISYDPYFSTNRISLLDRGFVFAIAHVRGGGIVGRRWYESGKLLQKKNSFTDFIACAEKLVAEQYCDPEKMFASGGSAGGLLVGAVLNMRPNMFKGVILDVPFVDVLNTMLDPTIPLTVPEYDEWGNPASSREYYDYIKSYAPYENVQPREYTNILITAGLNDPRVPYWEPAKLTARLRASKTDDKILILKTDMGSGHGGPSGRYQAYREMAFEYAFVLMLLDDEN